MRLRILATVLSTLVATGAAAQPDNARSMEPAGSPFTFEALRATPSLRLHKERPRVEAPARAVDSRPQQADAKASREQAVVKDKTRAATAEKQ